MPDGTGHPRRRQILAVLCLSLLVVVIDNTILNTALPTLARDLRATTTDLQWITDAYTLAFAALLIVAGALGDRYGRRGALLLGLSIFGLGSMAAALSDSATALIAFRAVMGIGGALVMPATLSILTSVFPAKERAGAIAAWSAVAGIGIVVGPTLGGFLLAHFSWSSVFWVNVPLVAVTFAAVYFVVPSLPGRGGAGGRLDLIGAGLSAFSLLAIVDAVIEGPNRGWGAVSTVGELLAGTALMAGFVARELAADNALIDVRVFRHRAFSAATAAVGITFFALFGSLFALTQYLQLVHGYPPFSAGLRALPFAAGLMSTAPLSSVLVKKFGIRRVLPVGLLAMGGGLLLLSNVTPDAAYLHLAIGITIMGLGMGLVIAPAGESMMSVLPAEQAGVGSAVNDTVQELGGSLGVAVIGSVVSASFRHGMDGGGLPAQVVAPARSSIAAADAVATHAGPLSGPLTELAHRSFTSAMTTGFTVAGLAALLGALVIALAVPARNAESGAVSNEPADDAASEPAALLYGR